jgi:hypothetical protein
MGVTGRLQIVRMPLREGTERGPVQNEDRDRILWENGLVRRIQETEYKTENMKSLVYVLYDCGTNNCSSAR